MKAFFHWIGALLFALGAIETAHAHKPSDSYLTIRAEASSRLDAQWDIALRDLEIPLHLDANGDGDITWGEVRTRQPDVFAYATRMLHIAAGSTACMVDDQGDLLIDQHTDGQYAVLRFGITCPSVPNALTIDYGLFADIDPSHRGLLRIEAAAAHQTAVLVPRHAQTFELGAASGWRTAREFLANGVEHIWIGYDHILFLVSLLLPSVLVRRGQRWWPVARLRDAVLGVLAVVTAFTLSHSITLTLAALGMVGLPSRIVESGIALSVLLAALNNVFPLVSRRVWLLAFGFGFVHGLGFASVLADLGLPRDALALALASFNVGVEIGQLSIVAVVVPLIFVWRANRFYRPVILVGGSCVIAAVATLWLVSRVFDLGWG